MSRRFGRPTESRQFGGGVIVFCIVKLMNSLSPTVLSYVNKTNVFFKITFISCPLLHGLVSFSWWVMEFDLYLFFLRKKERGNLLMIPQAAIIKCQNMWHKLVGLVSEQGHRFVFHAFFILYIYIYLTSSLHSSYFNLANIKRESSSFSSTLLPSTYWSHRLYCHHLIEAIISQGTVY